MIEQIVNEANALINEAAEQGVLTKRLLAVGIEINQLYEEYLDELLDSDLHPTNGVTVDLNGQVVTFPSMDAFSKWLAENIT